MTDVSRRGIFGLALAGPTIVKNAAAAFHKMVNDHELNQILIDSGSELRWDGGKLIDLARDGRFSYVWDQRGVVRECTSEEAQKVMGEIMSSWPAPDTDEQGGFIVPEALVPEVKLRLSPVPNNLYGAYINEDGDAV